MQLNHFIHVSFQPPFEALGIHDDRWANHMDQKKIDQIRQQLESGRDCCSEHFGFDDSQLSTFGEVFVLHILQKCILVMGGI